MAEERGGQACSAAGCGRRCAARLKGVPLCLHHVLRVEGQLALLGLTLDEFGGNVLSLLDMEWTSHVGRALSAESRLIRKKMRQAREALAAGQVKFLELDLAFARAQFDALSRTAPAHKSADLAGRLRQLQDRIADLESRVGQARQSAAGLDPGTESSPA